MVLFEFLHHNHGFIWIHNHGFIYSFINIEAKVVLTDLSSAIEGWFNVILIICITLEVTLYHSSLLNSAYLIIIIIIIY